MRSGLTENLGVLAFGDHVPRQLPADRSDLALQAPHPGLAGESLDERVAEPRPRTSTCAASSPFALSCFGTRNWLAIVFFSFRV